MENKPLEFQTDLTQGLSIDEVNKRLKEYGYNEVPEHRESLAKKIAKKFWGLTPWILEATAIFTYIIGRYLDCYIIVALLIVNAIIALVQEERASRAVELLKQKLQVQARVLRDGNWTVIPAREIVPGDIVRIRAGDFVPADLRVVDTSDMEVDQSALTGESMPVKKSRMDLVYSGSMIRRGEATCCVVATGLKTYFGKTVELVQTARPKLHMEEIIGRIIQVLLYIVITLIAAMLIFTYLRGLSIIPIIPFALMLIVFAVPVALPAMFTVSMAYGSLEMAKNGALLTRLSAIEDVASMEVLCADKTGTLTRNKLVITEVIPVGEHTEEEILLCGALASQEANRDPIDLAFIESAKRKSIDLSKFSVQKFIPFDPSTRRTEAHAICEGEQIVAVKGAINTLCSLSGTLLNETMRSKIDDLAKKGYRALAVGRSVDGRPYDLLGIVALYDEPRPDTKDLIEKLREYGVKVKMLTGDAIPIAKEIAKRIGLGNRIIPAGDVAKSFETSPEEAAKLAEESDGFAEIYPEQKYAIVKSLQAKKHIVGMTGDGINDSPALKQAEVGIAVSDATDVAKGAAGVVLTNEGLGAIVNLVLTGRSVFQRINTWILNKIVKTIEIAVFSTLAFLITSHYVLSAMDVVLFLFLIDFVTISLSTDNERGSQTPEVWNISSLVKLSVSLGIFTILELFVLYFIGTKYFGISPGSPAITTYFFTAIMFFGLLIPILVRERSHFWSSRPSNTLLMAIIADFAIVSVISSFGFGLIPRIPIDIVGFIIAYAAFVMLVINDGIKVLLGRIGIRR
ncbi:plasma-membrane proton-efflux P-type ATPase [Thermoplasma sp.]|uniref:plasma-membrane proton-efflux P-type ATPase n=1 Tax=Thermoplasma sp. TaxID=1973142 RepID=UPI00127338FD|nr:plasma-membrane proton-efflux P-type ATPase [Thermoplasma sp.]KAA8921967.1 MAG: plasma-membrane proton-efflux P-type ATPase [Thermoplasma sp.]